MVLSKTPLLEEKEIQVRQEDISAIESTKKSCIAQVIPWPDSVDSTKSPCTKCGWAMGEREGEPLCNKCNPKKHPKDCMCGKCHPTTLELENAVKETVEQESR